MNKKINQNIKMFDKNIYDFSIKSFLCFILLNGFWKFAINFGFFGGLG
jgi:hypothetical protein